MKKKNKTNIIPIIGIIAYALYFIMYILIQIYNVSFGNYHYQTFFHTTILNILKILILYGLMVAYLCINVSNTKKKKANQILEIILLVVTILLIVSDIRYIISYATYTMQFIGNKIYVLSNMITTIFSIVFHIFLAINLLGLIIQKKFPYKVLMIITLVILGLCYVTDMFSSIIYIVTMGNIRGVFDQLLLIISSLFYTAFQVCLTLTIYKNTKEMK